MFGKNILFYFTFKVQKQITDIFIKKIYTKHYFVHCTYNKVINKTDRVSAPRELSLTRAAVQQINNYVNNCLTLTLSALKEKHRYEEKMKENYPPYSQA